MSVTDTTCILDESASYDPAEEFEAFLKRIPSKWVVYLLADEQNRPVQLLCVKNLRSSLRRRLGEDPALAPSRRVDYRQLVRRIHWRRVHSRFEADFIYLEAARRFFPKSYRGMTGMQPAWFIHVNPDAPFPRYTKTIDLQIDCGELIGPVEDKHAANRLIEEVADWFDLCRYHNILVQSPDATACAYKEMGKCPAPCDGSISMEQYRNLVDWSARTLVSPEGLIADATQRMKHAAAELKFESAGRIKAYVDSLSQLGKGPLRHVRRLRDFNFLGMQRGPRDNTAKAFLITPGEIEEIAGFIDPPSDTAALLRHALELAEQRRADSADPVQAERIGVVAFHLFQPKAAQGVFLPLGCIDEKSVLKAFRDVQKQKAIETDDEAEGVLKELQIL